VLYADALEEEDAREDAAEALAEDGEMRDDVAALEVALDEAALAEETLVGVALVETASL